MIHDGEDGETFWPLNSGRLVTKCRETWDQGQRGTDRECKRPWGRCVLLLVRAQMGQAEMYSSVSPQADGHQKRCLRRVRVRQERTVHHSSSDNFRANSSHSTIMYLCSAGLRWWEKKAQGWILLSAPRRKKTPLPLPQASNSSTNCYLGLGMMSTGAVVKRVLSMVKAVSVVKGSRCTQLA